MKPIFSSARSLSRCSATLAALAAMVLNGAEAGSARLGSWIGTVNPPLYFEATPDRGPDANSFVARGRDCNVWLAPGEATLLLGPPNLSAARPFGPGGKWSQTAPRTSRTVRLILQGANYAAAMTGLDPLPGKANYLLGNDPAEWRTGIPLFSAVQVDEVYPGVRLVYYADSAARLEYDFLLQPGARPEAISFRIEGADRIRLDAAGDLVLKIGDEEVRQHRPIIYQETQGVRKKVEGGYRLLGKATVGFRVGPYDRGLPLVIDPTLSFSSYLGGSKVENGWAIALDAAGNIYVAGETLSKALPGTNGVFQPKYAGGFNIFGDAFVAKFDSVSNELVYLTYLGGRGNDAALALHADAGGNAYVTGFTDSRNFPIVPTSGAIRSVITGNSNNAFRLPPIDAFVAEIDPTGSTLLFSTLLGGTRRDSGRGITADGSGISVCVLAESTNFFPTPTGFQTVAGGGNGDAVIVKLLGGTNVVYSTYLGGTNFDSPEGIAVDSAGNAWVTGYTFSTNFPIVNPISLTNGVFTNGVTLDTLNGRTNLVRTTDAFISRISTDGAALLSSSYLGGSNNDAGLQIAVDAADNAYVTGYTSSRFFPTNTITQPASTATNFTSHAFVTVTDPNGALLYSSQFGSSASDQGLSIAVSAGNVFVSGFTSSTNFFATNAFTNFRAATTNAAGKKLRTSSPNDAFVAVLSPDLSIFVSTNSFLMGGSGDDQATGIAVDPSGSFVCVVGKTTSPNLPLTNSVGSLIHTNLGGVRNNKASDAFIGKILLP